MSSLAWLDRDGAGLWSQVASMIARGPDAAFDPRERERLVLDIASWQRAHCLPLDRALRAMGAPEAPQSLDEVTGLPTDAFKTARIACFAREHETRAFHTSGTTRDVRGSHPFASLALYDAAAIASGARWLLRDAPYRFVLLAEREEDAPHSSLTYMLARFAERFAHRTDARTWMIERGQIAVTRLRDALRESDDTPIALLGATWAFVHAIDALRETYALPPDSVVMPTGGFKGRSRELEPPELFATIERAFGVSRAQIVQEYGMTELSSQAYEAHREGVPAGRYVTPPWMIVTAMDPVTLTPLPHGRRGVLRVIDLANVGSSIAIQTADLGTTYDDGFEVHGRSPGATPRGCARAIDALLSGES
jgi:hypothetical protein